MENAQNLKFCPWTSEAIDIGKYSAEYHNLLDNVESDDHTKLLETPEAVLSFFPERLENEECFNMGKFETDCSIDLLTVPGEMNIVEDLDIGDEKNCHSGRLTSWYTGHYIDGVIPDGSAEKLITLKEQESELYKRASVPEYIRNRFRQLKYYSTVRMPVNKENAPFPLKDKKIVGSSHCLRDCVVNVRVQRPFHKKTHYRKASNRFPTLGQELLLLGSQSLCELRDAIICINANAVSKDFSSNPSMAAVAQCPSYADEFPSGFFYINGVFYLDTRHPAAKDYSTVIQAWAKRIPEIGEMKTAIMEDTKICDLTFRLGYPYVFMHLGDCEHLFTFSDMWLHHPSDNQNKSLYPLFRGRAMKHCFKCYICENNLANWIVLDDETLPVPNAHVCHSCLQSYFYDSRGKPKRKLKVYAFCDEGNQLKNP